MRPNKKISIGCCKLLLNKKLNVILSFAFLLISLSTLTKVFAEENPPKLKETLSNGKTTWLKLDQDLHFGQISLYPKNNLIDSQIYVVKFNLNKYILRASTANKILGVKTASAKEITSSDKSFIASINSNFFDEKNSPLGIIIDTPGIKLNKIHSGGKLLDSIFYIKNQIAYISNRSDFSEDLVSLAIQSGPQIIASSKLINFGEKDKYSRRSGIAITKDNEILFYATALRFPGTSLSDIQNALLNLGIDISDALNLDGGGSSQLYIRSDKFSKGEVFISGGNSVPAFLILSKNSSQN